MTTSKIYFLMPTRSSPPDGPVVLGSIITDPIAPELSLNWPALPSAILNLNVNEVNETDQSRTIGQEKSVEPSVWAKFSQSSVIGGDVGAEAAARPSSGSTSAYHFDKIVTREIFPDLATVQEAFNDSRVQASMTSRHWRQSMYMIVGVQVAYGAKIEVFDKKGTGYSGKAGVDLTPASIPISVGAGLEYSTSASQSLSTTITTPFVFAYRLRQILYKKKIVREQRDHKGNLLGDEAEAAQQETPAVSYDVQMHTLMDESEEVPELLDLETETAADENGNECRVVMATT